MRIRHFWAHSRIKSWRGKGLLIVFAFFLLPVVTGCAGSPWGESLSGSFPTPPEQSPLEPKPTPRSEPEPAKADTQSPVATTPTPTSGPPGGVARPPSGQEPSAPPPGALRPKGQGSQPTKPLATPPSSASGKVQPSPLPPSPSPYRVTIRLPQADPSAPAEGVTQALRAAGIPFEVETIERVKGAALSQGPELSPGAPSTARRAPPPR